jgi:hypothetical protein
VYETHNLKSVESPQPKCMTFLECVLQTLHNGVVSSCCHYKVSPRFHCLEISIPIKFSIEGSLSNNGPRAQPYFNMIEMLLKSIRTIV